MPRVHTIQNNRKEQSCRKCGETIAVGAGYKHWKFRYGGKVTRCLKCPHPRASELTQSGYLQQLYGAQESFDDQIGKLSRDDAEGYAASVVELLESAIETAQNCVDEYEEALGEWEHGNSMIEEKRDACEEWKDALENARDDIESTDVPEEPEDGAEEEDQDDYVTDCSNFCDEIEGKANDAIHELSM